MDGSVIIATHNRRLALTSCLASLRAQDLPPERFEIIVVDDGSTDGTSDFLREVSRDAVLTPVVCPERRGPAAARNRGLAVARGETAIFVDDDTLAPPWFVREHILTHRQHGPLIVDGPAVTIQPGEHAAAPPFARADVRLMAHLDFFGRAFATVNASARLVDLKRCGGFDEGFQAWEDVDLGRRLRAAGLARRRNRRAYVLHCRRPATLEAECRVAEERGYYAAVYYRRYGDRAARWQARLRYLRYDAVLVRCGLAGRNEGARAEGRQQGGAIGGFELIHAYARGLRAGLMSEAHATEVDSSQ